MFLIGCKDTTSARIIKETPGREKNYLMSFFNTRKVFNLLSVTDVLKGAVQLGVQAEAAGQAEVQPLIGLCISSLLFNNGV